MNSSNPFAAVNWNGVGVMRGVTLALDTPIVQNLLPAGLDLGSQSVTPSGKHPVVLFFHDLYRAQMSFPNPLYPLSYREFTVGIPFTYLSGASITPGYPGPYYFMPWLYLDNLIATVGGVVVWGFAKHLASMQVREGHYAVSDLNGRRLTSLSWDPYTSGVTKPASAWPHFAPVRQMIDQPLISTAPAGIGPFFTVSDFDKNWNVATVRPLRTAVRVDVEFLAGYPAGRYPHAGWSLGINESVLGSFELRAPFRLSLPYHPLLNFRSHAAYSL